VNQPTDLEVLRRNARQLKRTMQRVTLAIHIVRALGMSVAVISVGAVVISVFWYGAGFWKGFMVFGPAILALHLLNDRRDTLEERRDMTRSVLTETLITMERALARSTKETP